jgi:hypothetical protein
LLPGGVLRGRVTDHPTISDGDVITTSECSRIRGKEAGDLKEGTVVRTDSGSRYRLGKMKVKAGIFGGGKKGGKVEGKVKERKGKVAKGAKKIVARSGGVFGRKNGELGPPSTPHA